MRNVVLNLILGVWLAGCVAKEVTSPTQSQPVSKGPKSQSQSLPCAVATVLRAKCQQCHGHPTQFTAPMSLTTWDELHAPALEHPEAPALVHERVAKRIHDVLRPMPPRDQPQLSQSELSVLDIWLGVGAPTGDGCDEITRDKPSAGDGPAGAAASAATSTNSSGAGVAGGGKATAGRAGTGERAGAGGESGRPTSTEQPAAGNSGASGASGTPTTGTPAVMEDEAVRPEDSECEYIELRARQDESGAPFQVGADATDLYQCFLFDMKFDAPTQALSFETVPDNLNVVHHWLLRTADRIDATGPLITCDATYPTNKLVAGWAPGSSDWYLPKDVGIDLGRGLFYLEVHYNNIGKPATTDRSGARICTTKKLRPKNASVSWLGTQLFTVPPRVSSYEISGRCQPAGQTEPIHIVRTWPHMHMFGVHASMFVDRADRTRETIFDDPFSFSSQRAYDIPVVLQPGDSIMTSCFFDNPLDYPVTVGTKTTDEMCHFFVIAYPAFALTNNVPSTEPNVCLGLP